MTKIKRIAASILAVAAMATSVAGMSASAYSPTISRTVGGVKGTLYSDTTYGYGTTSRTGTTCYVKVTHGGVTSSWKYNANSVSYKNIKTNGTSNATSSHRTNGTSAFTIQYN